MKCFVILSLAACSFAAPTADAEAEAQYLAYGHGLVGGVYAAAPAATVAVAHTAPVAHAVVPAATYGYAAPALTVAAPAAVHVATAPVVHHVGYNVHRTVHHVP